jgi:diguanylate cyclase (GGDEF)-like protein
MLSWKRKSAPTPTEGSANSSAVLANCVGSLKLLVVAPREDKSVKYIGEIENHLQNSGLDDSDAAQRIRAASEKFSKHQRDSIEHIIAEFDRSMRTMIGSLDDALTSGDTMMNGVGNSTRKLNSMQELRTFEDLRKSVAEEAAVLAAALAEYRQSTLQLQEKYRKELAQMRSTLDKAQIAAKVDGLTNLPNRTCHEYQVATTLEEVAKGQRYALALIDLDGFKTINDTHGHAAGDAALVAVTQALCKFLGRDTFVARLGGDEFTIIAKGTSEQLERRLTEFTAKLANTKFDLGSTRQSIAVSYGVADVMAGGAYGALMKLADERMYANKRAAKSGRAA